MAQLNKLIKERGRVKGHMTRTEAAFAGNQQMTVSEAQVRLRKLEEYWHEFQQVQKKIDDQAPEDAEELAAYEESNEAERGQFEQKYFAVAAQAQTIIENARIQLEEQRRRRDEEVYVNHQQQPGLSGQNQIRIEKHTEARLPEIKLTEFDGDWTKWLFFKNSFKTSVIENQKLSKMLKHQYLISVLKGEALKVIEGFEISEENFPIVWQLLEDTYSNEMMIMESHLEQLVNLPSISSDDKAQSIKTLIWHIQTHSQSLKVLGQPVDQWDSVIIHLAKKKLDYSEQKEWQEKIKDKTPDNMPKLAEFIKFLTERCHTLRILNQTVDNSNAAGTENTMKPGAKKGRRTDSRVLLAATLIPCKNCDGGHHISRCDEFLKLNTTERKRRVIEKKLCLNCLKPGHLARDCASSTCRNCGGKHNTLLHEDKLKGPDNREYTATVTCCTEAETPKTPMSFYCVRKPSSQVILSTAQVNVYDSRGTKLSCRALLDPGSQINLITEELMKKLELPHIRETRMVSGINQVQTIAGKVISIKLESKDSSFKSEIECLVLPSITEKIPQARFDKNKVMVPKDIKLADPSFNVPGNIDLLIGAGLYWRIINGGPRNDTGQPAWQSTKLGWIVGGEIMDTGTGINTACFKVTNSELQQQLERFWVQETLPEIRHYTKEEEYCETLFVETLQRNTDGRFVAKLPLRTEVILGESRQRALRRLQSVERRFHKNPELAQAYTEFMEDYMRQGHMSLITETALLQSDEVYFIPHQPVIRPDSITTKLRVVFDASAKTSQGTSLNDKLMPGPNIQGDLFEIILRFRTHEIVLTGDITQMYRQIIVHPNDRKYQLILWRQKSSEKEKIYQLNTVTYGTACAPFHALRCLKELAERHEQQYPMAAEAIQKDFYMDDCLSGRRTVKEVKELQHELAQLLLQGKFVMRKWRTNAPELVQELGQLHQDDELLVLDKEEAIKTLGLYWNSRQDVLQYQVDLPAPSENTKRSILSRISQIFDPLGLVAPILINGKLFMQKLWSINIDWDDQLPDDYLMQWNNYYSALPKLNDLIINRNVNPRNKSKQIDIYGFDDASEKAYGACIYIVSENQQGEVEAHLLCTKSKVAPLKSVSVPGLELEAALLLSKLVQTVKSALSDKIANIYLWSDSTIVLGWIQTEPSKLKTFVGNRVAKIQQKTEGSIWNHVQSQENPADFISRGLTAENLIDNQLWWHGPSWISSPSRQPNTIQLPDTELPEMKINNLSHLTIWSTRIMKSASSFSKLCKTLAICYQFIDNCRKKRRTRKLSTYARNSDENRVLMWVQEEAFSNELHYLINNQDLPKKSPLRALKAFVGEGGLIRVGGRLHNAELHYNEKHQILLPSKHHITRLIMREEHVRLKHCPPEQLLHSLRARYWPIHGRREAQVTVRHCIPCFKFSPQIPETLMGDLPEERVKANSRAFSTTGVDYAGPFQIRESKRRGRIHISKGYVAVFVCLTTKAIHLELVSELTTECFLAALHRFTARRGICSKIFSDNGTNFIGASRELKNIYEFLLKEEDVIAANLEKQRIEWSFIPPRGPHFGGLWEAGVKVMKRHLMTVTQGKVFTFEEYYTLLTAIEAIMNSRPLTPLSNDAHDYSALTPSHFLIGDSLLQPVQHNFSEVSESRLSRWEHLQKLRQLLWKRWQREYLQELQRRNKWQDPSINIIVDTLVLLIEDHVSPLRWPMGRVVAVHPGQDGIVRVVTLRTATGTFKRPVKKVCPLPIAEEGN